MPPGIFRPKNRDAECRTVPSVRTSTLERGKIFIFQISSNNISFDGESDGDACGTLCFRIWPVLGRKNEVRRVEPYPTYVGVLSRDRIFRFSRFRPTTSHSTGNPMAMLMIRVEKGAVAACRAAANTWAAAYEGSGGYTGRGGHTGRGGQCGVKKEKFQNRPSGGVKGTRAELCQQLKREKKKKKETKEGWHSYPGHFSSLSRSPFRH
eukprot:COSAG01_NODE_7107_length_3351_cov_19.762608_3_plen_208_part_00